jgi:WD40 repeat protein
MIDRSSAWLPAAVVLLLLISFPARAAEPAPPRTFTGGQVSGVFHVAYSPDGKLLASCGKNASIILWDATGKDVRTLIGHVGTVYAAAFSPDGKLLASAGEDQKVRIWSVPDGKELRVCTGHTSSVYNVAFSPDGKTIASASGITDCTVKLWNAETGQLIRTLSGHTDRVLGVAFSPDGSRLATACGTTGGRGAAGGEVRVWDVPSGEELYTLHTHTAGVLTIVFSPDGKRLAGACLNGGVRVWETASGKETLVLEGHAKGTEVYFVAFSPDSRLLASCGGKWDDDKKAGEVKLWDLTEGRELMTLPGYLTNVWSLAFSPDGKSLATAMGKWNGDDGGGVRVWDLTDRIRTPQVRALTAKELNELWSDLEGTDPARAYRAVWRLSQDPEHSVPFLTERAQPTTGPNPLALIPKWIADLDAEEFAVREKATAELEKLGTAAHPELRKAMENGSLELRRRAATLLERKGQPPVLPGDEMRIIRVVEVLQHIGTQETVPILRRLAEKSRPGTPAQKESASALERRGR